MGSWSGKFKLPVKDLSSLNVFNGVLALKNFSVSYSHLVPRVSELYNIFAVYKSNCHVLFGFTSVCSTSSLNLVI